MTDSGMGGTDAGMGGTDAGMGGTDAGPTPGEPCARAGGEAPATVGCNGFQTAAPAANADFGDCTLPDEEDLQGSCTSATSICWIDVGAPTGVCVPFCEPGPNAINTSTCATGSRCFNFSDDEAQVGLCFRDCDATHPCPDGQECDPDGSCVGPAGDDA